jgi:TolB-like protein/DNA-binding winged helix-turn-helix (wHTH) protein
MKTSNARAAKFGPYSLDLRSGELWKFGTKIKIGEQSFRILCLLLDASGEMVPREELQSRLWAKDTFVDFDHGLNSAVQRLRDCLSDSAEKPRWIETVPRRGYRFVGEVEWEGGNGVAPAPVDQPESCPAGEAPRTLPLAPGRTKPTWALPAVILTLAVLCLAAGYRLTTQAANRRKARMIRSLAVLPLDNLSGDSSQDYFAAGITDELTTMLAKNRSLLVTSRTSAMQFKGAKRPLPEIARELGVDGILEGSVERLGNRVHMTVQLIYAPTDTHVWAETYDRDLKQAFLIPEELSQTVAKEVKSAASGAVPPRYISAEAHDDYLQGRYFWFAGNDQRSQEYFEKAIHIQPDYAAAWAGLANSYHIRAIDDNAPAKDVTAPAEAAARKAVELDDSLPEAHHALAAWYLFYAWNPARAETEARRSIALDPGIAEQHHLYSYILLAMNRKDEVLQEQERATELDPFVRSWGLGHAYIQLRQFDAAISELRMRADAMPNESLIHVNLSAAYWYKGMWNDSQQEVEKGLQLAGDPVRAAAAHRAFQRGGEKAMEEWSLRDAMMRASKGYVSPYEIARRYAFLGDRANTLKYLELCYEQRYPWLILVQGEPEFDFVHSDPRYRALINKLGLPVS